MSYLTIRQHGFNDWMVWIALERGDPTRLGMSFVIGGGATREEAIKDAQRDIDACSAELQRQLVIDDGVPK